MMNRTTGRFRPHEGKSSKCITECLRHRFRPPYPPSAWCPKGAVSGCQVAGRTAECRDCYDTLSQLWHPEVGDIYLAKRNSVPGLDQRIQQIHNKLSACSSEKTLNILENDNFW